MLVQNMNIFNRDNPFENGNKMATILLDSFDTERGVPTAEGKIGCLYEESIGRKIVKRGLSLYRNGKYIAIRCPIYKAITPIHVSTNQPFNQSTNRSPYCFIMYIWIYINIYIYSYIKFVLYQV